MSAGPQGRGPRAADPALGRSGFIAYIGSKSTYGRVVATPNYGYEKRQKELAKRRKKEDKLRAKAERKLAPGEPDAQGAADDRDAARPAQPGEADA